MWNITILRVWYGFSLICTLFLIFDLIHYSWFLRALFFTHANHNMTFPTVITGNQMARRWHLLWVFVPSSQVTGNPLWKKNMWILKAVPFLPKRKFLYKVPIIFLSTQCNVSYGLFQNLSMLASYHVFDPSELPPWHLYPLTIIWHQVSCLCGIHWYCLMTPPFQTFLPALHIAWDFYTF